MKVALITGIDGFLGRHLATTLRAGGTPVVGVTRHRIYPAMTRNIFFGDITNRAFVSNLIDQVRPNLVFHLAANKARTGNLEDFRRGLEENLFGTLNLVEACIGKPYLQRFISIGTCEEYGHAKPPFYEEMRESPVSAYSLSKASVTQLLQTLYHTHRFPAVVLRPSLAYGPGQATDMFLPALIETLLLGKRFSMSEGKQTRDYVFRDDLIEAVVLASTRPEAIGEVINISSGVPIRLKEIARLAAVKIGNDAERLLDIGKIDYRANEIMDYVASYQRAENRLGWHPRTGLDDGLTATIEYFRKLLQESDRH